MKGTSTSLPPSLSALALSVVLINNCVILRQSTAADPIFPLSFALAVKSHKKSFFYTIFISAAAIDRQRQAERKRPFASHTNFTCHRVQFLWEIGIRIKKALGAKASIA